MSQKEGVHMFVSNSDLGLILNNEDRFRIQKKLHKLSV